MTREQFVRADKRVFILIGATLFYMVLSMLYAIVQKTASTGTYIQMVIFVLALCVSAAGYLMFRGRTTFNPPTLYLYLFPNLIPLLHISMDVDRSPSIHS